MTRLRKHLRQWLTIITFPLFSCGVWDISSIHSTNTCNGCSCRGKRCCAECNSSALKQNYGERNETHKVKAELPHVFLKHNNEKQCMKKKNRKRDMEKGADSCTERGRRRVEMVVVVCKGAYKPNSTLMLNGRLRWHVPSHGIFYSLSVPCSCCCVFLYH